MQEHKRGGKARWLRLAIVAVVWIVFATTFVRQWRGDTQIWARVFGVPAMAGPFADLSQIAAAVESAQHGLNPYLTNPYDMAHRPYIYPRVWLYAFSALRITPHRIVGTGIALACCFLMAVSWLILRQSDGWAAGLMGLAACSSATAFAIERGNTDLIVFCLVVVASELGLRTGIWFLVAASVLKVYPFFALLGQGILKPGTSGRRTTLVLVAVVLGATGIAIQHQAGNRPDTGVPHGYGFKEIDVAMGRAPESLRASFSAHTQAFRVAWDSLLGLLCCSGLAMGAVPGSTMVASGRVEDRDGPEKCAPVASYAFVLCAAIFVGTFLLSTNYDYRLIFLIPMLPFLMDRARTGVCRHFQVLAAAALGLILFGVYRGMAGRIPWPRLALAVKVASHVDLWALLWIVSFFLGLVAMEQYRAGWGPPTPAPGRLFA